MEDFTIVLRVEAPDGRRDIAYFERVGENCKTGVDRGNREGVVEIVINKETYHYPLKLFNKMKTNGCS